jgi:hypothetical protein
LAAGTFSILLSCRLKTNKIGVDGLVFVSCIACYLLSLFIVFAKVRGFSALMRSLIDFRQVRFCHYVRYIIIAIIFVPPFFSIF